MQKHIAIATIATLVHFHLESAGCTAAEINGDPICFERTDGTVVINGEHPFCGMFCDYYGEFQDGEQFILDTIETFAETNGLELEWETPGTVIVYGLN
jgi:hypothetical protein